MSATQTTSPGDVAPYDAVVGLVATFSDGSRVRFSGALISPTEVLTAAHGVWRQGLGQAISVVAIPFGVPQYTSLGAEMEVQSGVYAAAIHTNQIADANNEETIATTQSDIALIDFGTPLTSGPVFGLLPDIPSAAVSIAGFPGGVGPEATGSGSVTQVPGYTVLSGTIQLGPGSSGGPIWVTGAGGQTAIIGTVSTSDYATGITAGLVAQIGGWQAADRFATAAPGSTTAPGTASLLRLDSGVLTSGGSDTVQAGGGAATLYAAGPSVSVLGGSGGLVVVGGYGSDTVRGGTGSSTLFGGTGGGVFEAGQGGDSILVAGAGNTTLVGGGTGDALFCAPQAAGNLVAGGAGQQVVVAGQGAATIVGGSGALTVFAGSGADNIDTPYGLGGEIDVVGFKAGVDHAFYGGLGAVPPVQTTHGAWGTTILFGDGSHLTLFGVDPQASA